MRKKSKPQWLKDKIRQSTTKKIWQPFSSFDEMAAYEVKLLMDKPDNYDRQNPAKHAEIRIEPSPANPSVGTTD